jgi:hypothetical protein
MSFPIVRITLYGLLSSIAAASVKNPVRSAQNSVQILYEENVFSYAHGWSVYFGPQGVPVDPCAVSPFLKVHQVTEDALEQGRYSDVNNPPPTPAGAWAGLSGISHDMDCTIAGDGKNPPTLQCGAHLVGTFKPDPRREERTATCGDALLHHRAYFIEFPSMS